MCSDGFETAVEEKMVAEQKQLKALKEKERIAAMGVAMPQAAAAGAGAVPVNPYVAVAQNAGSEAVAAAEPVVEAAAEPVVETVAEAVTETVSEEVSADSSESNESLPEMVYNESIK